LTTEIKTNNEELSQAVTDAQNIKPEEKVDFVIVTNAESDIAIPTISCVMNLFGRGYKFIWDIRGAGGYARTRNVLSTAFLKNNRSEVMICLDRDLIFNPDYIDKFIEDYKNGWDLVGGLYPVKDGTHLTSFGLDKGDLAIDGTTHEVKWLATGFGMITRRLLQKMVDEIPFCYTTPDGLPHTRTGMPLMNIGTSLESYPFFEDHCGLDGEAYLWLSEDYEFCNKARLMGAKPAADTRIWLGHIGQRIYEVKDVLEHQKTILAEIEAKRKAEEKPANVIELSVTEGVGVKSAEG
jgi:hypothetical protein